MHRSASTGKLARLAAVAVAIHVAVTLPAAAEIKSAAVGAFEVRHEVAVPGTAEEAFDAFTGDVSGWWDHHFSEKPLRLVIEPRPGGGFWEVFDEQGNGARHATVIFALRGKRLRFEGPLGFSGFALQMVHTVDFDTADEPGMTRVVVTVRGAGQMEPDWVEGVDRVWHHFLVERYKPYVEALHAAPQEAEPEPPPQP